ncbi:MAG: iron exporter MbfA [Chthoniobacterales bacterium]
MKKAFRDLSEQEILALAIGSEEDDARIYADIAAGLKKDFPHSAAVFEQMQAEESTHRHRLLDLYQQKFGDHIPLIRRDDVKGFIQRKPIWLFSPLRLEAVRSLAEQMEIETQHFYVKAATRSTDPEVRKLLGDLAEAEKNHADLAEHLTESNLTDSVKQEEDRTRKRLIVLQIIQPALAGLMDGSVSTLAPLFAAALATHSSGDAFRVGLAASAGAGISMGFAEALSDDGSLSGRGQPWIRGTVCGAMTALGGLGHTLPFLLPNFHAALVAAIAVVVVELAIISWIRHHYMDTPWVSASLQVGLGGALVFAAGLWIGSA